MKYLFSIIALAALVACSSQPEAVEHHGEVPVTRKVVENADVKKCTAKLAVEGMSCAMMCGNMIKKSLSGVNGVKTANIDFKHENKVDFAEVEFDEEVVTEKELVAAIEKLNDGQYKVKSVEITVSKTSYEKIDGEDEESDADDDGKITAFNQINEIHIPNVFDVFRIIIQ